MVSYTSAGVLGADVGSIWLNFVATKLRNYEIVRNYKIHFVATKLGQMEPTSVNKISSGKPLATSARELQGLFLVLKDIFVKEAYLQQVTFPLQA